MQQPNPCKSALLGFISFRYNLIIPKRLREAGILATSIPVNFLLYSYKFIKKLKKIKYIKYALFIIQYKIKLHV